MYDTVLTVKGQQQAAAAAAHVPLLAPAPELIVCSPLTRCAGDVLCMLQMAAAITFSLRDCIVRVKIISLQLHHLPAGRCRRQSWHSRAMTAGAS